MSMTNEQVVQDFYRNFPDSTPALIGDQVVFLMVQKNTVTRFTGILWQSWNDGTRTILVGNVFMNAHRAHVRKAQISTEK